MALAKTGINYIDALLLGKSWSGAVNSGYSVEYTFFAESESDVDSTYRAAVESALRSFSEVANIGFQARLVSSLSNELQQSRFIDGKPNLFTVPLQFRLGEPGSQGNVLGTSQEIALSFPALPSRIEANDITVLASPQNIVPGSGQFTTLLHEIGHAIGLSHPDDETGDGMSQDGTTLPLGERTADATIMLSISSTFLPGDFTEFNQPITPMIYDIAALQYIYGANMGFHNGNDVYSFDGTVEQSRTIWDAGGIDAISTEEFAGNAVVDLREGIDNVTQVGDANTESGVNSFIWLAFGSNIENAHTGVGNDQIFGNHLNNNITGNSGNDFISADAGTDFVNGNAGNDTIRGDAGADFLRGGKDSDVLYGGADGDTLMGDLADDILIGDDGDDFMNGNVGNDLLVGGLGNDFMRGGQDQDQLFGDVGNDTLYGDKGNDTLSGGAGGDIYVFTPDFGADTIQDFDAFDILQISSLIAASAADVLATTASLASSVFIDFGAGNSITILGITSLAADDILIA